MRMFTLFDFSALLGATLGAWLGARLAYGAWGWPSLLLAAPSGLIVGWFVGNLPLVGVSAWLRRELRRSSVAEIERRLEADYYLTPRLLAELASRGEPLSRYRGHVERLVRSSNPDERRFGESTARAWFPELVDIQASRPGSSMTP